MLNIIELNYNYFKNKNIDVLVETVFTNFAHLVKYPKLKHTTKDIRNLLESKKFFGFFIKENTKIIAYLFGEVITLLDGRTTFFISYLYVSKFYRKRKLASQLIDHAISFAIKHKIETLTLICDTEDSVVNGFYLKRGFMLDLVMRRYEKYDIFSLPIAF